MAGAMEGMVRMIFRSMLYLLVGVILMEGLSPKGY